MPQLWLMPNSLNDLSQTTVIHLLPVTSPTTMRRVMADTVPQDFHYSFLPYHAGDPVTLIAMLCAWWTQGFDLVMCSPMQLPAAGSVRELQSCDRPMCGYPVWTSQEGRSAGYGHRYYRAPLQAAFKNLPELAVELVRSSDQPTGWLRAMESFDTALAGAGVGMHAHRPPLALSLAEPHSGAGGA